ncbi:MAG: transposase [Acidobacteria bacterium]|nr:transposase [Acidobacteriota bacterium]
MLALMSRPHRLDPSEYVGIRQYFLTICTHQRNCEFGDADTIALVWAQFLRVSVAAQFAILAYCFMPDHLHAIVTGQSENADFRGFVRRAKQRSGFAFAQVAGRRLWQESYFERLVRSDERVAELIKYIIENPVRAGLVERLTEYPHWGSQIYSREELLEFVARECRV